MKVTIRPVMVEDARDVAEVRVVTWQKTYLGLLPEEYLAAMNIEEETQNYSHGIANLSADRYFCVAEIDTPRKGIAGYCICGPLRDPLGEPDPKVGEIYQVYVLPEYQGQGIGRALIQSAARWLASKGYQHMIIFVLRENFPSRKFYEALGGRLERERIKGISGFQIPEVGYSYELCEEGLSKEKKMS